MIDATHYYVRLLSLKTADFKEDLGTVYSQLQMDIGLWYGNLANLVRHSKSILSPVIPYLVKRSGSVGRVLDWASKGC